MVKFLCTRQDSAERLGVQSLTFSGYLCPGTERLGDLDDLSPEGDSFDCDSVTGLCLLNKTLFFIQQLTRDMVTPHLSHILRFSQGGLIFKYQDSVSESQTQTYFVTDVQIRLTLTLVVFYFPYLTACAGGAAWLC